MSSINDIRREMKKRFIDYPAPYDLPYRRTGRTTGDAFHFLGEAIRMPNKAIKIMDHTGDKDITRRVLIPTMQDIIRELHLAEIYFDNIALTVEFKLIPWSEL